MVDGSAERSARIAEMYYAWCGGWGLHRNAAAAQEAAHEIAAMLRQFPADIAIPSDDDEADDLLCAEMRKLGWTNGPPRPAREREIAQIPTESPTT